DGSLRESGEMWASRLRDELRQSVDDLKAQATHDEEEMRAALVAQIDLELREAQEQGTVLREEIEGRVRDVMKERMTEADQRRAKEVRDLEQRLGLLVDGRTKDVEIRLQAAIAATSADTREQFAALGKERSTESDQRRVKELRDLEQRIGVLVDGRTKDVETRLQAAISGANADVREKLAAAQEARVSQAEKRWSVDGEARSAQRAEAQTQALAAFRSDCNPTSSKSCAKTRSGSGRSTWSSSPASSRRSTNRSRRRSTRASSIPSSGSGWLGVSRRRASSRRRRSRRPSAMPRSA